MTCGVVRLAAVSNDLLNDLLVREGLSEASRREAKRHQNRDKGCYADDPAKLRTRIVAPNGPILGLDFLLA